MEDINDLLYDDVEAKYLALQNKKKNRRKKKLKVRLIIQKILKHKNKAFLKRKALILV